MDVETKRIILLCFPGVDPGTGMDGILVQQQPEWHPG